MDIVIDTKEIIILSMQISYSEIFQMKGYSKYDFNFINDSVLEYFHHRHPRYCFYQYPPSKDLNQLDSYRPYLVFHQGLCHHHRKHYFHQHHHRSHHHRPGPDQRLRQAS